MTDRLEKISSLAWDLDNCIRAEDLDGILGVTATMQALTRAEQLDQRIAFKLAPASHADALMDATFKALEVK